MILTTNKWDEQCKNISTNHLMALCEIGEDYKTFCDELEMLIKSKTNIDFVVKVCKSMQGKFSIYSGKYKSFIEKHKDTIEIMNKYNCLRNLTVLSYDTKGNRRKNLPEDYFYEYIQNNRENLDIIKEVILNLKKLGFTEIEYGENLDFTETDYDLDLSYGSTFAFLENIEVNSTYLGNPIKYRSNGSHYCIYLETNGYGDKKEISKYNRKIYLNSLILDSNTLPNEITIDSTIGIIKRLADSQKSEFSDVRNSVDLSIATIDLKNQYEYLKQVINKIDKAKNNEELSRILEQMQSIMMQLQKFNKNFEEEIIDSNASITEQTLEQEKKLYLDRRYLNSIDVD